MKLEYIIINTKNNHYLFDPNTSKLVLANELMLEIIENYNDEFHLKEMSIKHENFEKQLKYLNDLIKAGMFSSGSKNPMEAKADYRNNPSMSLIIVLTGRCNLRCEYCVYNDKYPKEIGYSNEDMNIDVAIKAIDQFLELYYEKQTAGFYKKPTVMFYGGEPLLKFELIKKIVSYIENVGVDCDYYMTTNGVLLNENYSKYLIEKNFRITFSLDGYPWNHNRNRIDIFGNPSHKKVVENIKKYERIKLAENKNIMTSFNCCYDDYTNLEECVKFFTEMGDLIRPFYVMYSYISPYDTTYYNWLEEKAKENGWEKQLSSSYKRIKERFVNGLIKTDTEKAAVQNLFASFYFTDIRSTSTMSSPLNNCCIPLTKLAVYPDGTYAVCERVNKKLPIGNVFQGIDYDRINQITEKMEKQFKDGKCSRCNYRKMCNVCFQFMDENGDINKEFCERTKRSLLQQLTEYCELREYYPDIIEKFHPDSESWKLINILA